MSMAARQTTRSQGRFRGSDGEDSGEVDDHDDDDDSMVNDQPATPILHPIVSSLKVVLVGPRGSVTGLCRKGESLESS